MENEKTTATEKPYYILICDRDSPHKVDDTYYNTDRMTLDELQKKCDELNKWNIEHWGIHAYHYSIKAGKRLK